MPTPTDLAVFRGVGAVVVDSTTDDAILAVAGSIYRVHGHGASGVVTRIAGDPQAVPGSGDGGSALAAGLGTGGLVAVSPDGTVYVIDTSGRLRSVDGAGVIHTIAGGGAAAVTDGAHSTSVTILPGALAASSGHVYVTQLDSSADVLIFDLNLATGVFHLIAGGGSATVADGLPATSVVLPQSQGLSVRPSDGAVVYGETVVRDGVIRIADGPPYGTAEFDAAGNTYIVRGGAVWKVPAGSHAPLLLYGSSTPISVGSTDLIDTVAVAPDGTTYVVDTSTATPSLLEISGGGAWSGPAPTLAIQAPASSTGYFQGTVTAPPGGPTWRYTVVAAEGTVAPTSPSQGDLVIDGYVAGGTADGEPWTIMQATCGTFACQQAFKPGHMYSFALFAYPDGSPAQVPVVTKTATFPTAAVVRPVRQPPSLPGSVAPPGRHLPVSASGVLSYGHPRHRSARHRVR